VDRVFQDNSQFVYRTAYSIVGCREDAEDILQALFLRLLQRGLSPRAGQNTRGYLYRATINLALDTIRARQRQISRDSLAHRESVAAAMDSSMDERIVSSLHNVVTELDDNSIELLLLRYADNLRDAEIARIFGTSRGTIAVRLHRTRAKLRELMRAHGHTQLFVQV
jgi:RNA polymerase sigma-70 factor (ECF subfamily)